MARLILRNSNTEKIHVMQVKVPSTGSTDHLEDVEAVGVVGEPVEVGFEEVPGAVRGDVLEEPGDLDGHFDVHIVAEEAVNRLIRTEQA